MQPLTPTGHQPAQSPLWSAAAGPGRSPLDAAPRVAVAVLAGPGRAWLEQLKSWRVPVYPLATPNQLLQALADGKFRAVLVDAAHIDGPWLPALLEAARMGTTPLWLVTETGTWCALYPTTGEAFFRGYRSRAACVMIDPQGTVRHRGQLVPVSGRTADFLALCTLAPGQVWNLAGLNLTAAAAGIRPWTATGLKAMVQQVRALLGSHHLLHVQRAGYRFEPCSSPTPACGGCGVC